ncbi:serine hydrolase domain-containing protein [Streptomyces celluloflavus]|uniref:serine hydrolase domain-containing protein n=1 Tax=Streptomyces celluloflavus TaxID=58344 RepID=UPI0036CF1F4C
MILEVLTERLPRLAREHGVPGGQFALHHEGATHSVVFGEERIGGGQPVREDSKFPAGSLTKAFTAALAMVLVDEGDLGLDRPLAGELPELRAPDAVFGTEQTLRQLLSHSSGLPPGRDSEDLADATRRGYLADCARMRPIPVCGSSFSYSNVGYCVTGFLIEHAARMDWREALESIVLDPLGIEAASITADGPLPYVTGHAVRTSGAATPVRQTLPRIEASAGALALSAADLVAFGLLHTDGSPGVPGLLDARALAPMREPVPGADPFGLADGWGLGLSRYRAKDGTWRVGHDGTADGTSCHLRIDPATGTVAALTTNANTGMPLWEALVAELAERGLDLAGYSYSGSDRAHRPRVPAPPDCAGHYENGDTAYTIDLAAEGDAVLRVGGEPFARLTVYDDLSFTMRELAATQLAYLGRFLRAPDTGVLEQIQVTGRRAQRV